MSRMPMAMTNAGRVERLVYAFPHPGSTQRGHRLNQVAECDACGGTFVPGFPHSCKYSLTNRATACGQECP